MIPDQLITVYSSLILIFIGLVVPVLGISLPLFNKGIEKLKKAYENNYLETEEKISQLVKDLSIDSKDKKQGTDISETIENLKKIKKELKKSQRETRIKLIYLKPQNQIILLLLPLTLSLASISIAMLGISVYTAIITSLVLFIVAILLFLQIIKILTEVQELLSRADEHREEIFFEGENKKIALLEKILDETSPEPKERKVFGYIDDKEIKDGLEISLAANRKHKIEVVITNKEKNLQSRNVELGFEFPPEFEIEEKTYYRIYKLENNVRFQSPHIPASERRRHGKLMMTPLKVGLFDIHTWIKGDDMKTKYFKINFNIVP